MWVRKSCQGKETRTIANSIDDGDVFDGGLSSVVDVDVIDGDERETYVHVGGENVIIPMDVRLTLEFICPRGLLRTRHTTGAGD